MVDPSHVELFYDVLDASCMAMYDHLGFAYLRGVAETGENILSGTIGQELPEDIKAQLSADLVRLGETRFAKEEIRKAMQLAILKGLKHAKKSNADITPDTIGIFVGYLLSKLLQNNPAPVVFDPLAGSGNLLSCVANLLEKPVAVLGVEADFETYKLLESMIGLQEWGEELYCQNTLSFSGIAADAIVTDFPYSPTDESVYFPYEVIKWHRQNLKPGGYLVAVIWDDFFDAANKHDFHAVIDGLWIVVGLIKLPATMFKGLGKSLFLLRKTGENVPLIAKALMAEIPSFQNPADVGSTIATIDRWLNESIPKE